MHFSTTPSTGSVHFLHRSRALSWGQVQGWAEISARVAVGDTASPAGLRWLEQGSGRCPQETLGRGRAVLHLESPEQAPCGRQQARAILGPFIPRTKLPPQCSKRRPRAVARVPRAVARVSRAACGQSRGLSSTCTPVFGRGAAGSCVQKRGWWEGPGRSLTPCPCSVTSPAPAQPWAWVPFKPSRCCGSGPGSRDKQELIASSLA